MKASTGWLLAALAAAGIVLVVAWNLLSPPEAPGTAGIAPAPSEESSPGPRAGEPALQADGGDRVAAGPANLSDLETASGEPAQPDVPGTTIHVRGRVLNLLGEPIYAVGVGIDGNPEVLASSDPSGTFEFDLDHGSRFDLDYSRRRIVSKSDGWITVRYALVKEELDRREHFLIVAPPIALSGKVVDPSRQPIPAASLAVRIPIAAFAGFPFALDSTGVVAPSTKTGEDGVFALERVPSVARAILETSAPSFADDERPLPTESAFDLLIELGDPEPPGALLEGVVVHEDGSPAAGASVHLVDSQAKTDGRGSFRLEVRPVPADAPLVAILKGFQPAVILEYGRVISATDGHPPSARLVLGPRPLSIAGRILEADGRPCARWMVTIAEGTAVSQFRIPVITAEGLTAGGSGTKLEVQSNREGAFVLQGLRDMPYVLQAWSTDGRMTRSLPIQAGTQDAEIRCEPEAVVPRITGRVVSRDGMPLEGLHVSLDLVTFQTSFGSSWLTLKQTKTREDGTFEIERVPKRFTQLSVNGEGVESKSLALDELDLDRPIEVVVMRTCRFRFEGEPGKDAPTRLTVLDADGSALGLVTREAGSMSRGASAQLTEGRSHVLSVREDAVRLVLYRGEEILSSQPLRLVPGEIVAVRRER